MASAEEAPLTHPSTRRSDSHEFDDHPAVAGPELRSAYERLAWTCLTWTWGARYTRWEDGLGALARALRGLEEAGLITRHTARAGGELPLHGLTLTKDGHAVLEALRDRSGASDR